MANFTLSPNMDLPVPIVGVDPGPEYATDVNSCLAILDQHNHTPGSGVAITPAAMNINADLTFNTNNATSLLSARFTPQLAPIPATGVQLAEIYVAGVDLYYNDYAGNQIQITKNGAVAGTPGSISNLVSPASASYNNINDTFVFQSNTNTPANLDAASIVLRNLVANSQGLTLSPPNAMGSSYTLTLPPLPATTLPVQLNNMGQFSTGPITFAQLDTPTQTLITPIPPTIQVFTASGTYTLPTSSKGTPIYIEVEMVGGGGGGGPGGTAATGTAGGNGGNTTFGSILTANGGQGGPVSAGGVGSGGTASISSPAYGVAFTGGSGQVGGEYGSANNMMGSQGASSPFGGAGVNNYITSVSVDASPNTGSGGAGGSGDMPGLVGGSGGAAGGYLKAFIPSPSTTYAIVVGTGGSAGIAASFGFNGSMGAAGIVIVREYYQ